MKELLTLFFLSLTVCLGYAQDMDSIKNINKQLAKGFYEDLWFSQNTDAYTKYMAEEYKVYDINGDNGLVEKGIVQKEIADFFWENGDMSGTINYQLADGDKVATRWEWKYKPKTLLGRLVVGEGTYPIINVFRFKDGKIVETWNHRHDIDMARTNIFVIQGLLIGLAIAIVPLVFMIRYKRKLNKVMQNA